MPLAIDKCVMTTSHDEEPDPSPINLRGLDSELKEEAIAFVRDRTGRKEKRWSDPSSVVAIVMAIVAIVGMFDARSARSDTNVERTKNEGLVGEKIVLNENVQRLEKDVVVLKADSVLDEELLERAAREFTQFKAASTAKLERLKRMANGGGTMIDFRRELEIEPSGANLGGFLSQPRLRGTFRNRILEGGG